MIPSFSRHEVSMSRSLPQSLSRTRAPGRRWGQTTAVAALAFALAGCSLIPDLELPAAPVPAALPQASTTVSGVGPMAENAPVWADIAWQDFFVDPTLRSLIAQALDHNRDLRVAALTVEVARATYRVREADLLPEVTANGGSSIQRVPRNASAVSPARDTITRRHSLSAGVTAFELDLFGRVRSLEEAALESYLATEEARNAAQISLIAEVANAYLTLLGDRKLLSLTEETLQTREQSLGLIERSFQLGVGSQLDVAQARSSVETARANRLRYLRQVEQDRNALSLLVGQPVDGALPGDLASVRLMEDIPVGLSSDLLLRRPDIMQAEHSLRSANANIGAARAAFFPTISLTGSFGLSSTSLSSLFQAGSGAWAFAPQISLPLFDGGKNEAELDSAKANRDIGVARYEKAIQTAFREVADALAARGTYGDQLNAQNALVDATRTSTQLSQARYDRGIDSYLNVLDAQRSLYAAQQEQVSTEVARLSTLVTLYKALGGGVKE